LVSTVVAAPATVADPVPISGALAAGLGVAAGVAVGVATGADVVLEGGGDALLPQATTMNGTKANAAVAASVRLPIAASSQSDP
jgi:hypothetical protein